MMTARSGDKPPCRIALSLIAIGLLIRLLLAWRYGLLKDSPASEAYHVAVAFARTGTIADAYFPGQGPTAHLSPVTPMIAGWIYAIFGVGTNTAGIVLLLWSLAQVALSYFLLWRLFVAIGFSRVAANAGLALLCLLPFFARSELEEFRYWEAPLTVSLVCVNLLMLFAFSRGRPLTGANLALAGLLAGFTFFVHSIAGLAIYCCWAIFALGRSWRERFALGLTAAAGLALFLVPWTIRNAAELGAPVPLRSNFGLELALGNHAAAVHPADPGQVFLERIRAIHPASSARAAEQVRKLGEVEYSRRLGNETRAWLLANKPAAAILFLRHWRQFFFPELWLTNPGDLWPVRRAASIAIPLIDLLGLLALAAGLVRRRFGYAYLATFVLVASLPYMLVQPVARYSYLVYGMLAFLAAGAVVAAAYWLMARIASAARTPNAALEESAGS